MGITLTLINDLLICYLILCLSNQLISPTLKLSPILLESHKTISTSDLLQIMAPRGPTRPIRTPIFFIYPHVSYIRRFSATTRTQGEFKQRSVVGSFIFQRDKETGQSKLLLFKRSDTVSTYKGKYAIIAGGIESWDKSPYHAARREIEEETLLRHGTLQYLCAGKRYSITDNDANYKWDIHPFAFYLTAEAQNYIYLNEEHVDWAWFDPYNLPPQEDLAAGVIESLRRVWPGKDSSGIHTSKDLTKWIFREHSIRDAQTAYSVFLDAARQSTATDKFEWWKSVVLAAWHVGNNCSTLVQAGFMRCIMPGLMHTKPTSADKKLHSIKPNIWGGVYPQGKWMNELEAFCLESMFTASWVPEPRFNVNLERQTQLDWFFSGYWKDRNETLVVKRKMDRVKGKLAALRNEMRMRFEEEEARNSERREAISGKLARVEMEKARIKRRLAAFEGEEGGRWLVDELASSYEVERGQLADKAATVEKETDLPSAERQENQQLESDMACTLKEDGKQSETEPSASEPKAESEAEQIFVDEEEKDQQLESERASSEKGERKQSGSDLTRLSPRIFIGFRSAFEAEKKHTEFNLTIPDTNKTTADQITSKAEQKRHLETDLATIELRKKELEATLSTLKTQTKTLNIKKAPYWEMQMFLNRQIYVLKQKLPKEPKRNKAPLVRYGSVPSANAKVLVKIPPTLEVERESGIAWDELEND